MNSIKIDSSESISSYTTKSGVRIFQIPVHEFPILWGNVYLVFVEWKGESYRVLIDTGSGFDESNKQLEQGFHIVSNLINERISIADLTHILITHGHIDHFGGLAYLRPLTKAQIGVHELDLRNLTNYEERLIFVARRLDQFLIEAGVGEELRVRLIELYKITKSMYRSINVDFTFQSIGMRLGPFQLLHVPGHCAGHVVFRIEDVLFSGDHILQKTSPHQSPEHLTLFTGLEHYLQSLDKFEKWSRGTQIALGGHEEPITNLNGRIGEIRNLHMQRIARVLDYLKQPHTIAEVSFELFGEVHGYNTLLALEEAGAHIEYLYQRGLLAIDNLASYESGNGLVPICYKRIGT